MAKYTAGILAGVVSGKVGNVVFSRGRYGPYIRNRMIPTRADSEATRDVRGRLSTLSKAWGVLGASSKVAWKTYAQTHPIVDRLGNSQVLQGSAAFIQLNARLIQALGTQITLPPVESSPLPVLGLTVTIDIGVGADYIVEWTSGATGVGECVAVWAAVSDSPGRDYYANMKKLILISGDEQATQLDIETALVERFGSLIVGQRVFIECEVWDKTTGLVSARSAAETTVVSTV
jgi:hypothetical protein